MSMNGYERQLFDAVTVWAHARFVREAAWDHLRNVAPADEATVSHEADRAVKNHQIAEGREKRALKTLESAARRYAKYST